MSQYEIAIDGLQGLEAYTRGLRPEVIEKAALLALSNTLRFARSEGSKQMRSQIAFSQSYVAQRLTIARRPTPSNLEGSIKGSDRPTSLARFVQGTPQVGKGGVVVRVGMRGASFLKKAFPIRLRRGNSDVQTKSNLGLAVRSNSPIRNKRINARPIAKNLYLLYGPSIDQVFGTITGDGQPYMQQTLAKFQDEFTRQLDRMR